MTVDEDLTTLEMGLVNLVADGCKDGAEAVDAIIIAF